jgi:hypothetical protein
MPKLLLFFLFCHVQLSSIAQLKDYITVQKKSGKVIKSFPIKAQLIFYTKENYLVDGYIDDIRNDSVFVKRYLVKYLPTNVGLTYIDTVGSDVSGFHYKELYRVKVFNKKRFVWPMVGGALLLGGFAKFVLTLVNGLYFRDNLTSPDNLKKFGIATGALALGYFGEPIFAINNFSKKKHRVVYIKM